MRLVVFGEQENVSHIYGSAFDLLGVEPLYVNPDLVENVISLKPDVIMLGLEWVPSWRLASAQAKRAGIPVIYVMDGVIEWSYVWNNQSFVKPEGTVLQPLIAGDLCVIGRHPASTLSALGLSNRIHIVGLPRFDKLKPVREKRPNKVPRILIVTAKTWGHNTDQKIQVKQAMRDLKTFFAGRNDVEPIWRIDSELADEISVTADSNKQISEVLKQVDGLISFTSTTILEGMAYEIPVAQIEYRPIPMYINSAWEIRCANHIASVVQELLYPPVEKMAYQDTCYQNELESGNASDRLAKVIRYAIENKDLSGDTGQQPTKVYPRLDYRQLHSNMSAFSTSPDSLLQYELEAMYLQRQQHIELLRYHNELVKEVIEPLRNTKLIARLIRLCSIFGMERMRTLLAGLYRF